MDVGIHKDLGQIVRKDLANSRHLGSYGLINEKRSGVDWRGVKNAQPRLRGLLWIFYFSLSFSSPKITTMDAEIPGGGVL